MWAPGIITEKEVENLPLNGRTPLALAALSMGVVATGQPGLIHPFDLGGAAGWSIGGSPSQVNEILVDGSRSHRRRHHQPGSEDRHQSVARLSL
jgi:hypothetical protein